MSQHTPGPWRCMPISESGWVDIVADDPTRSAFIVASTRHEHAEDNARLIAAAPELLEVVLDILSDYKGIVNQGLYSLAEAAIAKATGKEA